jgi:hypothetical protein
MTLSKKQREIIAYWAEHKKFSQEHKQKALISYHINPSSPSYSPSFHRWVLMKRLEEYTAEINAALDAIQDRPNDDELLGL